MSHTMKILERIIGQKLKQKIEIWNRWFQFIPIKINHKCYIHTEGAHGKNENMKKYMQYS